MARIIKVSAKYEEKVTTFHLRVIRMHEESSFGMKFTEIADLEPEKKADASLKICVGAIAEWSAFPPTQGDAKPKTGDTKQAVEKFFSSMETGDAERISNTIVLEYQRQLQPEIVF